MTLRVDFGSKAEWCLAPMRYSLVMHDKLPRRISCFFHLGGRHVGRRLSDQEALTSQDPESRSRSCSDKRARIMYSMADTSSRFDRMRSTWMGQLTV